MSGLLALIFWLMASAAVEAATYQQCSPSSACTIGEFLYDDEYQPDTGASCTLTVKYPDGTSFLDGEAATGNDDGWYSYSAAIGTTTGLYRANLCCTSGTEYLCIDKSFEVKSETSGSDLTAADVWTYSSRELTGFGSLITDLWNHSSRSLTTFGDLVSNVWNYSTASTTTPAALTSIINEQTEQRELLEKLVNEPVVSFSLEDSQSIPDLNSKLEQSRIHADTLLELVNTAKNNLGDRSRIASLFDQPEALTYLTQAWSTPAIDHLNEAVNAVKRSLTREALENLEHHVNLVIEYLAAVDEQNLALEAEKQQLASLINELPDQEEAVLEKKLAAAKSRILTINQYPQGQAIIKPVKTSPDKKLNLKNLLFNLQALLGLNQQLLAANAGQTVRSLWLEEGSIVFRGVITNPSAVISQTVPIKFYLPRELKTENIISLDPALTSEYDASEEALYVTGEFSLQPQATKLVFVEVEDIWQLTEAELNVYRNQAAELIKPLVKTSYFAQGTVLKTEIDATLDKIKVAYAKAVSPENRIRSYREVQLDLIGVQTNLNRLQDLVAQASGTGSIFGFVGGVQTVAVWGILIIVIAGFVYLTVYMRQLKLKPIRPAMIADRPKLSFWANPAVVPILILATIITTVIITQILLRPQAEPTVTQVTLPSPSAQPSTLPSPPQEIQVKQEKQVLGETVGKQLTVPKNGSINIRSGPDSQSPVTMTIKSSLEVFVFEQENGWLRIGFSPTDQNQDLWVSGELVD